MSTECTRSRQPCILRDLHTKGAACHFPSNGLKMRKYDYSQRREMATTSRRPESTGTVCLDDHRFHIDFGLRTSATSSQKLEASRTLHSEANGRSYPPRQREVTARAIFSQQFPNDNRFSSWTTAGECFPGMSSSFPHFRPSRNLPLHGGKQLLLSSGEVSRPRRSGGST